MNIQLIGSEGQSLASRIGGAGGGGGGGGGGGPRFRDGGSGGQRRSNGYAVFPRDCFFNTIN